MKQVLIQLQISFDFQLQAKVLPAKFRKWEKQTQDFLCGIFVEGVGILQTTNKSTSTSMLLNTINQMIISIIT